MMKDAECSLVDNLIAKNYLGKISFFAIKLSTREHSASFMITGATENSSGGNKIKYTGKVNGRIDRCYMHVFTTI